MFKSENVEDLANCILNLNYKNILETTINSKNNENSKSKMESIKDKIDNLKAKYPQIIAEPDPIKS